MLEEGKKTERREREREREREGGKEGGRMYTRCKYVILG
jgi:hypothetical protein